MAPHRPVFELQQPSSPCGPNIELHAGFLKREFLIAYDEARASHMLATDLPLPGGAIEIVPAYAQTVNLFCRFEHRSSLLPLLCQEGKAGISDKKGCAGQDEPQMKATADDRPNVIVACIRHSLLLAQHVQRDHKVVNDRLVLSILHCAANYLSSLATSAVFEALREREFATPGLVAAVKEADVAFRVTESLGAGSHCAPTQPALNVAGGAKQRMNVLQHLGHHADEVLRLAIGPTDGTPAAILPPSLKAAREGDEELADLPLPKAATRLLRATSDPAANPPAVLLPSGLRGGREGEEELVQSLEKERATVGW
ncbi:hypothetical protein V5799_012257 [Amblyomma americanum]|uniref:Uncharacterized protein n=1 Tax=Amblyomma americanum TaxID=6943 RepID=A0AAQ4EEU1_AMBAM